MAIKRYIETHEVFRTDDLLNECGNTQSNRNLLSRAVKNGLVDCVRRGVYVSRTGRFVGVSPNRFAIAVVLFPEAVFAYQSALELYEVAHNITPRLVTVFGNKRDSVEYNGIKFESYTAPKDLETRWLGIGRTATSPAQTFVDCIQQPSRALGVENCLRSISGLHVDAETCLELAATRDRATLIKVACILDLLGASEQRPEAFERARAQVGKGYYVLGIYNDRTDKVFNAKWRVYLPLEAESWLNG